MGLTPSSPP